MKTKYVKYEIEWANGEKETVRIPAFIQPSIVKKTLPYSEVHMFIAPGYHAYLNHTCEPRIDGPAYVRVDDEGKLTPCFKHL